MRFTKVLAIFSFCTVTLSAKTDAKTAGRQRRSPWTELFDWFRMEPALAEGVSHVENVGESVNNGFRDKPNSVNAMMSRGALQGRLSELDEKVFAYCKRADRLIAMDKFTKNFEKNVIDQIEANVGESHFEGIDHFLKKGFTDKQSEKYLLSFLEPREEMTTFVRRNLCRVRDLHELVQKTYNEFPRFPDIHDLKDDLNDKQLAGKVQGLLERAQEELSVINDANNRWLEYKTHPTLTDPVRIKTYYLQPVDDDEEDPRPMGKYEKKLREYSKRPGEQPTEEPKDDPRTKLVDNFKETVYGIEQMDEHARFFEYTFLKDVVKSTKDKTIEGLKNLPDIGMKTPKSEKTLKDIIASQPVLKDRIVKNIDLVRHMRSNVLKFEREKIKEFDELINDKQMADSVKSLRDIDEQNQKWLDYKTDPVLFEYEPPEAVMEKDEKVEGPSP